MSSAIPGRASARLALAVLIVFVAAMGVRLLYWHEYRDRVLAVQSSVAMNYRNAANLIERDGPASLFRSSAEVNRGNLLGHPPGYPLVLAALSLLGAQSDDAAQMSGIAASAFSAVFVFLIAARLFRQSVAVIAGLMAALAPQFAYNSITLLPDSLSVFPVLAAFYLLSSRVRRPLLVAGLAGALLGISILLRANLLLLPLFAAGACLAVAGWADGKKRAVLILAGAIVVVAPQPIRNYAVTGRLIPVSLGAGQTLLEGIADYDRSGSLGAPLTDMELVHQEANSYGRPDYSPCLFEPDGEARDRARTRRALGMIARHPIWFASVMARRGADMFRLERVPRLAAGAVVSHRVTEARNGKKIFEAGPQALMQSGTRQGSHTGTELLENPKRLLLRLDSGSAEAGYLTPSFAIENGHEYAAVIEMDVKQNRVSVSAESADGSTLHKMVVDAPGRFDPPRAVTPSELLLFASGDARAFRITFGADSSSGNDSIVEIRSLAIHDAGPAENRWLVLLRAPVAALQRSFITAVLLPLFLAGIAIVIWRRKFTELALLLAVPAYFALVQSAFHTELRYVLALQHFMFVFAAVALAEGVGRVWTALLASKDGRENRDGQI